MDLVHFLIVQHFVLACLAAVLFFAGAALAGFAVKRGPAFLTRLPLVLFKGVRRLIGDRPGVPRLVLVIFGFNGTAMFLYMASGYRPFIPLAIDVLTGFNIAVILLLAGQEQASGGSAAPACCRWTPSERLTAVCGVAVLLIELPSFWYSIAMGVTLGREALGGQAGYAPALALRAGVYARLVLPALLVSALCEAVAIRGMQSRMEAPEEDF